MSAIAQLMLAAGQRPPSAWSWQQQGSPVAAVDISDDGSKMMILQTYEQIYTYPGRLQVNTGTGWVDRTPNLSGYGYNAKITGIAIAGNGSRIAFSWVWEEEQYPYGGPRACGGYGYSTNDGVTWTIVKLPWDDTYYNCNSLDLNYSGQIMVVAIGWNINRNNYYGGIVVSSDGGATYNLVQNGYSYSFYNWLRPRLSVGGQTCIIGLDNQQGQGGGGTDDAQMWLTTNLFQSVNNIQGNISAGPCSDYDISGDGQRIVATLDTGWPQAWTRFSVNGGASFTTITVPASDWWNGAAISGDGNVIANASHYYNNHLYFSNNYTSGNPSWIAQGINGLGSGRKIRLSANGRKAIMSNNYGFYVGTATN